jgi:prepilin-type N-terminal cleavage/methylation domain-containing protein
MPHLSRRRRGFTLVEILIVVVILGILATVVVGEMTSAAADSREVAFGTNLRTFVHAGQLHHEQTAAWPEDADSGAVPAGMAEYLDAASFRAGSPVGGLWDYELAEHGLAAAVGVHFKHDSPPDDAFMTRIDARIDDGNLATGAFRKLAGDRFYWVLAE